jgi:imidazolonepropionase-like amidohydrolase
MPEQAPWRFQKIIRPMVEIPQEHRILLGRVLNCRGDEAIEDGFVEFADGRITAIGHRAELGSRAAEGVETGGTILPGLFQNHGHLAWDGVHDLANQSMQDAPEIAAFKCAGNMLVNLRAGVTTFRDLGVNRSNLFAKQAVAQGTFPGPRLIVCGAAIVQTGGHTYWCCREASGADEMPCHDRLEFTDEELHAVIDEAHRNGLPITAHATFDAAINRVLRFGIDVVEHGGAMSDETIQLLLDRKVPIVTTFAPLVQQSQPEIARRFNIPEWKIAERQKAIANPARYEGLRKAAEAGVTIAFGTDCGSPAVGHDVIAPEMAFMVKVGVKRDAYDAIRSATSVAAALNRMEDRLGTLEAGKLADVIVVEGDPRADIEAIARVRMTFLEGRRMV